MYRMLQQNSEEGRLTPEQLILAYSSLVNGARVVDVALTQLCVDRLLDALKPSENDAPADKELNHRLKFVLISLISAVDAPLLGTLLQNVQQIVLEEGGMEARAELKAAVLRQVLEKVADAEKGVAMRWWLELQREEGALNARSDEGLFDKRERDAKIDRDLR